MLELIPSESIRPIACATNTRSSCGSCSSSIVSDSRPSTSAMIHANVTRSCSATQAVTDPVQLPSDPLLVPATYGYPMRERCSTWPDDWETRDHESSMNPGDSLLAFLRILERNAYGVGVVTADNGRA